MLQVKEQRLESLTEELSATEQTRRNLQATETHLQSLEA